MSTPFLGQIQPFGFDFPPRGWAECNGQVMSISQNTALFALLGTYYGGNGISTFALPNLQSRVPVHQGTGAGGAYVIGEEGGVENVPLTLSNLPLHNHGFVGANQNANSGVPENGVALANPIKSGAPPGDPFYAAPGALQPLNPASIGTTGGNTPHSNIQPYLAINWCIALSGIFPTRG